MLYYCCTTADILTKYLQQCFLFFIVGNSQVSVYRTIGPTLVIINYNYYVSSLKECREYHPFGLNDVIAFVAYKNYNIISSC